MKGKALISLSLACLSMISYGQEKVEFDNPLRIPINASGNFGELRGTHFHAGLDIKTQQRIGLPVYAPADGYVSRIKVSTWGYGKALYIDHPNGQTTVYGHLNAYAGDIADFVKKRHYAEKSFEIEMFPRKNELAVKKGDIIAYTGNTGGSGGPHLHFEVRDSKTQKIINPLKEGMDKYMADTQVPSVNSIYAYPISEDAVVNRDQITHKLSYTTLEDGSLLVPIVRAKGKIGFGVDIFDTADFNHNKNGVYKLEAFINGKSSFSYRFDTFSFAESGVVNALIDYEHNQKTKQKVQKLFYEKPYSLSVLNVDSNFGIIDITPNTSFTYRIVLTDYHGNEKVIVIPIEYADEAIVNKRKVVNGDYKINSDRDYIFEKDFVTINIPAKTFYNDFEMDFFVDDEVAKIHNTNIPLSKNIKVTFDTTNLTVDNPSKAFIGRIDDRGNKSFYNTTKKGALYTISTKSFGNYKIMTDDTPPTIYKPSFKEGDWLSNASEISFLVKDDLSGIDTIEGTINGKWILLDYEYKDNKIKHKFSDGIVSSGRNDVEIKVTDRMGNSTVYTTHFFRK